MCNSTKLNKVRLRVEIMLFLSSSPAKYYVPKCSAINFFEVCSYANVTGGEMVEAELRNIQIVTSPYTISLKKTPKYFKPGMSFDVTVKLTENVQVMSPAQRVVETLTVGSAFFQVEVLNPDKTPANNVKVVVDPGSVQGSTGANGLARLTINSEALATQLVISVSLTLHFY